MKTTFERLRDVMDEMGFIRGREFVPETRLAQDLGLDSLEMIELGMEVEDEFDLVFDLDDDLSARWPCVGNLVAAIDQQGPGSERRELKAGTETTQGPGSERDGAKLKAGTETS